VICLANIFVISGCSGAGKTTIAEEVVSQNVAVRLVTCTTRKKREGEKDKVDYNFFSRKKFEGLLKKNAFLEWAEVYGNYYGSLKSDAQKLLDSGKNVLIVVDVQGALSIKKIFSGAILIFVKAPSIDELKKRLLSRGKDTIEIINSRVNVARQELKNEKDFDFVVINDKLDLAINEVKKIILEN
jgi:guanylate kinase